MKKPIEIQRKTWYNKYVLYNVYSIAEFEAANDLYKGMPGSNTSKENTHGSNELIVPIR